MNTDPSEHSRRGFPHVAATSSLAMPFIAILLSAAWRANEKGFGSPTTKVFVGLLILACIFTGVVFAVVALCNVGRYESRGLLRRGIIGLVVNGIFIALFGMAFLAGFSQRVKARQTERELLRATQDLRDNTRKSFDPERGLTNANTAQLDRFREQLENAAPHLEGDKSLLAKVWSAYLAQVQVASKHWQSAYNEVGVAKVLDFSEVTKKEELRERRDLVIRYKATSDAMRDLVLNASDFYRKELRKLGASPETTEKIVRDLETQNAGQRRLLLEIRELDTRMSNSMLGIFTLLETHWGSWTCPSGPVVFFDSKTLAEYNRLLGVLKDASREQLAAQRKLVSVQ